MRTNLPVTNVEYPIGDDVLIVSQDRHQGKNHLFQRSVRQGLRLHRSRADQAAAQHHPPSGYAAGGLRGSLEARSKAGKPWAGAVKNRRKNGDFYWVLASATPIWENGQVTGYMSIRSKLPADQRKEAEHVYALLRANKAQAWRVDAGVIRRRSLFDHFAIFTRTLKARLITLISVQAAFMVIIAVVAEFGLRQARIHLGQRHRDRHPVVRPSARRAAGPSTIRAVGRPLEQLNAAMAKIAQGISTPASSSSATMKSARRCATSRRCRPSSGFDRE